MDVAEIRASGWWSRAVAVAAVLVLVPAASHARTTNFAGRTWWISDRSGAPGPNEFTNSCVWVDTNGALHLQIKKIGTNWYCGEVQTTNTLGYGEYRWYTSSRVDDMDTNVVGGLFTYEYVPTEDHEIDIEFAKAFTADPRTNLHYTIQPYYTAGHQYQHALSLTNAETTHRFVWNPGYIRWESWNGHSPSPPDTNALLGSWAYTGGDVPVHSNEHVYINLWMFLGLDPVETDKLEMVVDDFSFVATTGTLVYDEFSDTTMSNVWTVYGVPGSDGLVETNDLLRIRPRDVDYESLGYRTTNVMSWAGDGLQYVFSANLSTISVFRASTNTAIDLYTIQSFFSAPSAGIYDSYWASNAVTLKGGYDSASGALRIELYSKTNWPQNWGNQRFSGTVTNAPALFADTNGVDLQFILTRSNYAVRILSGTNEVPVSTNSGNSAGPHFLGSALYSGYLALGAQNEYDGRGTACWNRVRVYSDVGPQTSAPPAVATNEQNVVEIGQGDGTWRYPINTRYRKSRIQMLYLTNQIARSGVITQLEMYVSGYPLIWLSNYTIRLQHTAATNLTSSWVSNGWTTVYQGSTQITATGWQAFTFTNAFSYDSRSNLLVDFALNNGQSESVPYGFARFSIGSYRVCLSRSATSGDPLTWAGSDPASPKDVYLTNRYVDVRFVFQPASNRVYGFELCDEFNDLAMSNLWEASGNWDNAEYAETGGVFRVKPGVNAWQTSAYITTNTVTWSDTNGLYVFAGVLSSVRVDTVQGGEDVRTLMSVCSEKENAWYVTNSVSLQGRYDSGSDALTISFLTKTNLPSTDGTERFNGTIPGASAYFGGTNFLQMRVLLGQHKYQVRFADARGQPVIPATNSGSAYGDHNLGAALYRCYWLIGAQNTEAGRGSVFWDRTFVATSRPPVAVMGGAAETSTDGQGLITITNAYSDGDGDAGSLRIDASTNGGATWFRPWIAGSTGTFTSVAVPGGTCQVVQVAATNGQGAAVTNTLRITWNSTHPGNEVSLAGGVFTNVRVRIIPDDLSVQGAAVTSAAFAIDNAAPSAAGATVTLEGGAVYTFSTSLSALWSGFVDPGSAMAGYYCSLSDGGGTTGGTWTTSASALIGGATPDVTNTVYVWAADGFGNVGPSIHDSVIVLSSGGDWDGDGLTNAAEAGYGASPLNSDSDEDGMSDGWEVRYGLDPTGSADAAESGDDDGYPNLDEFLWGTDPTSTASHLLFSGERSSGGGALVVTWSSVTNRLYSLYYSDSAISNEMSWQLMSSCSNASGVAGMMEWTDAVPVAIRSFRLGVRRP